MQYMDDMPDTDLLCAIMALPEQELDGIIETGVAPPTELSWLDRFAEIQDRELEELGELEEQLEVLGEQDLEPVSDFDNLEQFVVRDLEHGMHGERVLEVEVVESFDEQELEHENLGEQIPLIREHGNLEPLAEIQEQNVRFAELQMKPELVQHRNAFTLDDIYPSEQAPVLPFQLVEQLWGQSSSSYPQLLPQPALQQVQMFLSPPSEPQVVQLPQPSHQMHMVPSWSSSNVQQYHQIPPHDFQMSSVFLSPFQNAPPAPLAAPLAAHRPAPYIRPARPETPERGRRLSSVEKRFFIRHLRESDFTLKRSAAVGNVIRRMLEDPEFLSHASFFNERKVAQQLTRISGMYHKEPAKYIKFMRS